MRVFVSTDFKGHWPVGTAAVVVARDEAEARDLLAAELTRRHLTDDFTLTELDTTTPAAVVLRDGDY